MKASIAALAATVALGASSALAGVTEKRKSDVTPITVKGNAFWKGDERFYVRGVDYQPGGSSKVEDPIADPENCKRDIKYFKKLGLNTVRIYHVDNTANHDECMEALAEAGIYLVLDVNTPNYSINRKDPGPSYNDVYLQFIFATVEMFAKYKNTLAFMSANEVINDGPSSKTAPYVKAVTRDIRQYISKRGLRKVPVGYSAADIDTNRLEMAQYMNCGTDGERSDFFAFNDYSWCSPSSFTTSGWDAKVKNFTGYGLPLFLSEYGCNTNKRDFGEAKALYSKDMTSVYSGGLVYEYSQEPSNYGLVKISKDGDIKELDDFKKLAEALKKAEEIKGDGGYNSTGGANPCPKKNAPNWDVDPDEGLPSMPEPAKKYLKDGAGEADGLKGKGSQQAGTQSSGTSEPGTFKPDDDDNPSSATGTGESVAAGLRVAPELGVVPVLCAMMLGFSTLAGASLVMF